MDDEFEIRKNTENLAEMLIKEDLDPYSVEELKLRKIHLEREVERTEAKIASATNHLSAAESLFK